MVVVRDWEWGNTELFSGFHVSGWEDETALEMVGSVGHTTV